MEPKPELPQRVHLVDAVGLGGFRDRQGTPAGEHGRARRPGLIDHSPGQGGEALRIEVVGYVGFGPGRTASRKLASGVGRGHDRSALVP